MQETVVSALDQSVAFVADSHQEVFFIEHKDSMGQGIEYIDAHLLASASLSGLAQLWTKVRKLRKFALPSEHCVKAIPSFEQILKVFVRDPAGHNGRDLKSLWVSCYEFCQPFFSPKKSPAQKGEAFSFDAWQ